MKIISFAWTTEALLAWVKTKTRRHWNDRYARSFKAGELVQAYDKLSRAGGKRVAIVRLTRDPYQERTSKMGYADYYAEGLAWMETKGYLIKGVTPFKFFQNWIAADELVWVICFEVIKIL